MAKSKRAKSIKLVIFPRYLAILIFAYLYDIIPKSLSFWRINVFEVKILNDET